mgnify:CR=1 FL=1
MKHLTTCNLLKELRAFCVTRQEGSMSKAAEILYASQPTISLQVKVLEEALKVKLFQRRGPRLTLTTEGEILYDLVSPLVQGIDGIKNNFTAHYDNLSSGELTIAAEASTILYLLQRPLQTFVHDYPGIRLKLANVTGYEARHLILTDKADLAVSSVLELPKGLNASLLASYSLVLIMPKNHPLTELSKITLNDIGRYGMITPSSEYSSCRLVKMVFALNGSSYKIALKVDGCEAAKKYVHIGVGISIVTEICITESDREQFAIVKLDEFFPARRYGIITRATRALSAPAQKLIEILNDEYHGQPSKVGI